MRIALAVVGGVALLGVATMVRAEDGGLNRSEAVYCSERCETGYAACMRRRTGKSTEDCPGDLMRCRTKCDPTATGAAAATRSAAAKRLGLSCKDQCQADYDTCIRNDDGKHGPACAKNVMVCRNGCPDEPSRPVAVSEPSPEAPTVSHSKVPSSGSAEPKRVTPPPAVERAATQERARQIAPAAPKRESARVATTREAAPPPDTREAATTRDAAAPREVAPPAAAAVASEPTSREAPPPRRSAWSSAWCAITGSCGSHATQAPLSCPDACVRDYETCIAREDPKRGGACSAESVRCKQRCDEAGAK